MPELVDLEEEEMEVSDQGVRDRDTQRKQSGKDYADKRFHARDRNVREGHNVLLEKKKENKLSPCYEKEPYQVISRYVDQEVLRSPEGVQYKRNLQHIKPFNMPDPKEQETPPQNAEPKPFETPSMAKDQIPMAESPLEDEPSAVPTAEQRALKRVFFRLRGCLLWLTFAVRHYTLLLRFHAPALLQSACLLSADYSEDMCSHRSTFHGLDLWCRLRHINSHY